MDPVLLEAFQAVKAAYSNAGLLAGAGALLTVLIRVYRSDTVGGFLPKKARWSSLPSWSKIALPFLLAGGGAFITALTGGATALAAAISAVAVGLASIGAHHGTKAAGAALDDKLLQADPLGDVSKYREALQLILPVKKPKDSSSNVP